jgi:hypothetical protein
VDLGANVNAADDWGITALMAAGNFGDPAIVEYLVSVGADLSAHDLGKKNDGAFGASNEPLMAVDYAIGVGTFRPNNSIVLQEKAVEVFFRLMKEKRRQTHHFRVHVERIHLWRRGSEYCFAGRYRESQKERDRIPGRGHHWRPGTESR